MDHITSLMKDPAFILAYGKGEAAVTEVAAKHGLTVALKSTVEQEHPMESVRHLEEPAGLRTTVVDDIMVTSGKVSVPLRVVYAKALKDRIAAASSGTSRASS